MIEYDDLRDWIEQARSIDELKALERADPNLEVGAIAQVNAKNEGPALLFGKLKGYNDRFRILTNSMANVRLLNLTLGLPIGKSTKETVEVLRVEVRNWAERAKDFATKLVDCGPIIENVEKGNEIDLNKFPVPIWHDLDGGRYIGTGVGIVTQDPDTGELNIGAYRVQLHDSRTVGFYISPGKHGRIHRDKYFQRGQPCPVVMIFGFDPLIFALAATEVPTGTFELNYMGAIKGEPVPVIKGEVTGLPIPANAEIAIEGFASANETLSEGPFGEWTGTFASEAREEPFVKVAALYYRNDAILLGSPPAKGAYCDFGFFRSVWRSAILYNEIVQTGIPNVKGVWCPPFGGSRQFIVVSIRQSYPGHAAEAGHIASQTRAGAYAGRYVVVVDDDIDPYDIDDVMWAVCTRSEPVEMDIIKRAWSGPLDPRIRKPTNNYHNSRGIIYGVKPYEWYGDFPATALASDEVRRGVFSKWSHHLNDRWKGI